MGDDVERQSREWGEMLKRIPPLDGDKRKWPAYVRPLTFGEKDLLGVDKDGVFYWNGKEVTVQKHFTLTWGKKFGRQLLV